MLKKILLIILLSTVGIFVGVLAAQKTNLSDKLNYFSTKISSQIAMPPDSKAGKKVIGFLPFWLIDKAQDNYKDRITQLSYFNLVINSDGTIQKYTRPGESDPGYHALFSGKVDTFLLKQRSEGIDLSLTIFSSDDKKINSFLSDPLTSAKNLITELNPLIERYSFSDINLDIEKASDASDEERASYVKFVSNFRSMLDKNITVTIDCPPISFVKDRNLCDPSSLAKIADYVVLMDYDFHNPGSFVTGPVSPQSGAGIVSEFDTESAVQAALAMMPASKLILAVPLYGYSWETINSSPRSAVMPGSAYSISSRSVNDLLNGCSNCKNEFDVTDEESHVIYEDDTTHLFHQIFYPNKNSMQIKINYSVSQKLAGMALWALGYEDNTILNPLTEYIKK
jgi:hypothetical protein